MKRFLLATPILMLLVCATVAADSVTILFAPNVTMGLAPNDGSGGNFAFFGSGPGFSVEALGGTNCCWDDTGFFPGFSSNILGSIPVGVDLAGLVIGGSSVDFESEGFGSLLFISSFTLPTNGKNFTTPVEMGFVWDVLLSDGSTLEIAGSAKGKLTFDFNSDLGRYFVQPTQLTTIPEPGSLFLTATGLAGVWMKRRTQVKKLPHVFQLVAAALGKLNRLGR